MWELLRPFHLLRPYPQILDLLIRLAAETDNWLIKIIKCASDEKRYWLKYFCFLPLFGWSWFTKIFYILVCSWHQWFASLPVWLNLRNRLVLLPERKSWVVCLNQLWVNVTTTSFWSRAASIPSQRLHQSVIH